MVKNRILSDYWELNYLSIYLSIHSAEPSFRVLRAVALSVQELKERL